MGIESAVNCRCPPAPVCRGESSRPDQTPLMPYPRTLPQSRTLLGGFIGFSFDL
jgi:hypothetical protein